MTSWFVMSTMIIPGLGYPRGSQHAPCLLLVANKAFLHGQAIPCLNTVCNPSTQEDTRVSGVTVGLVMDCGTWGVGPPRRGLLSIDSSDLSHLA